MNKLERIFKESDSKRKALKDEMLPLFEDLVSLHKEYHANYPNSLFRKEIFLFQDVDENEYKPEFWLYIDDNKLSLSSSLNDDEWDFDISFIKNNLHLMSNDEIIDIIQKLKEYITE